GVNVVSRWIAIDDLYGLTGHCPKHMRSVFASGLGQSDGVLGNIERAVAESFLHINEDVSEMAVLYDDVFGGVRALAVWILAHVYSGGLWGGPIEFDGAADACCRCRINRRRGRSCGRSRV